MKKIRAVGRHVMVTSRGVKEEMACGLMIPGKFLRNSNVGVAEDGRMVITLDRAGHEVDELRKIVKTDEVLAEISGGRIFPSEGWILGRKCEDPVDEAGIIPLETRQNQFVEVLASGPRTGVEAYIGWLAYIKEDASVQKVEDSEDDWLIPAEGVGFLYSDET